MFSLGAGPQLAQTGLDAEEEKAAPGTRFRNGCSALQADVALFQVHGSVSGTRLDFRPSAAPAPPPTPRCALGQVPSQHTTGTTACSSLEPHHIDPLKILQILIMNSLRFSLPEISQSSRLFPV